MGQVAQVINPSTFMVVNDKLSHGCDLLISDPNARHAFAEYIKHGSWMTQLSASIKADRALKELKVEANTDDHQTYAVGATGYILPPGTYEMVEKCLNEKEGETVSAIAQEEAAANVIETCFSSIQMKSVLLATLFPLFLESTEYTQWLDKKIPGKVTADGTKVDVETDDTAVTNAEERAKRLDELFQPQDKRIQEIIAQAAASVDEDELESFLSSGNWLSNLLASVEDLPLCVTLATASEERPGFPLVYVNKAFEQATLYSRKEIVGHNCKFLQGDKSEPDQIAKLSDALRNAQPCKVALTNIRKDGTEFFNLLAMKPVFNAEGVYSYVIGVQFDISQDKATEKQLKLVDDLLSILPNIFK